MAEDGFDKRGRYKGPGMKMSDLSWGIDGRRFYLVTGGAFQNQYKDDML
jgi:hypothetical protein